MKILGIDIGGSGIKGAIVDAEKGIMLTGRYRLDTPKPATPQAVADTFLRVVKHFNWQGKIGCGFPAALQQGKVLTASNIHTDWIGTDANMLLSGISKLPVSVINDADAAGYAEISYGAGKNIPGVVLLITIGTGLGSALFIDGKLVPNTELGHLLFEGDIAEKYAADSVRRYNSLDWDTWGNRLNAYLQHLEKLFYPNLIILGGGVSKKMSKFTHCLTIKTPVVPAQLRNNAGIIGAAAMAAKNI